MHRIPRRPSRIPPSQADAIRRPVHRGVHAGRRRESRRAARGQRRAWRAAVGDPPPPGGPPGTPEAVPTPASVPMARAAGHRRPAAPGACGTGNHRPARREGNAGDTTPAQRPAHDGPGPRPVVPGIRHAVAGDGKTPAGPIRQGCREPGAQAAVASAGRCRPWAPACAYARRAGCWGQSGSARGSLPDGCWPSRSIHAGHAGGGPLAWTLALAGRRGALG